MTSIAKEALPPSAFKVATAITAEGTLVVPTTTANTWDVCGAGVQPLGFTVLSGTNPKTGLTAANEYLAVHPMTEGTIAYFNLPAANAAIAINDELETVASGCIDLKDGAGWIVGRALEAVAENTGGRIKVFVSKYYASA